MASDRFTALPDGQLAAPARLHPGPSAGAPDRRFCRTRRRLELCYLDKIAFGVIRP
jgi:hypothetical protein